MGYKPRPEEIREKRKKHGLTQEQAGEVVYCAAKTWRQWEAGERGMSAGLWELFNIKKGRSIK